MGNGSTKHKTTQVDKRELGTLSMQTGLQVEELKVTLGQGIAMPRPL